MRGQMFIITMVFLVGLIFAVQSNLSQYSFIDLSQSLKHNDYSYLRSIEQSFGQTFAAAPTCDELDARVAELEAFYEKNLISGTAITLDTAPNCPTWDQASLSVTAHLKSIETETRQTFSYAR